MKKKGLVIGLAVALAVVIILAVVMLAVFANVVKKAEEGQRRQDAVSEELQAKIDEITGNLGKQDVLGVEDFKKELASQLAGLKMEVPADTLESAVTAALAEYGVSKSFESVSLTEAQIQLIVTRVLSGTVTVDQMETIVRKYGGGGSSLTASQIQKIVDTAMAKSLTTAEVKLIVEQELAGIKADIENIKNSLLTAEQLEAIVKKYCTDIVTVPADGDLAAIIANCAEDSILELEGGITLSGDVIVSKNITLDLGTNKIDASAGGKIVVNKGTTLTIRGTGLIEGVGTILDVSGKLLIEGGTYVGGQSTVAAIVCGKDSVVTISGGTFKAADANVYYGVFAGENANVVINNGTFAFPIAVSSNAVTSTGANLVINGGTFTGNGGALAAEAEPVIFWPTGTLSIYGGTFEAPSTVLAVCGGDVTLYGGTFTSTGAKIANFGAGSGSFSDGNVISIITNRGKGYEFKGLTAEAAVTLNVAAGHKTVAVYAAQADFAAAKQIISTKWIGNNVNIAENVASDVLLPTAYVDFEFANGTVTDAKGHVDITNKATVQNVTVSAAGKSTTVDALVVKNTNISAPTSYVVAQFNEITSTAEMKAWAEKGFTVEAFYLMNTASKGQGVVCATEKNCGWGIAQAADRRPYFITGNGGAYNTGAYAKSAVSSTELVHVVGVYDFENMEERFYVNGVLAATVKFTAGYGCIPDYAAFNRFCLGGDIKPSGDGGDFGVSGMTMVDAKIYSTALNDAQADLAYKSAMTIFD